MSRKAGFVVWWVQQLIQEIKHDGCNLPTGRQIWQGCWLDWQDKQNVQGKQNGLDWQNKQNGQDMQNKENGQDLQFGGFSS